MFAKLLALFICVPLIELVLLIQVGQLLGLWPTLALVVATGFLGASLARQQGFRVWNKIQMEWQAGRMPAADVVDGLLILIGGIVLLTPGLLTDAAGFALMVPAVRRAIRRQIDQRWEKHLRERKHRDQGDIIDV